MPGPLVAGLVGSVASGAIQSNAAGKASRAQQQAANDQIAESRRQFDLVQSLLSPYVGAGSTALQSQLDLMGIGGGRGTAPQIQTITTPGGGVIGGAIGGGGIMGGATRGEGGKTWRGTNGVQPQQANRPDTTSYSVNGQSFGSMAEAQAYADANRTGGMSAADAQRGAISNLANGENFQALLGQGEYGIMANAAATGGLRGGDTQGALAQFRPQMLQSLIQQQLAGLGGIAANGQNAAAQTGTAAQNTGQQVNQSLGNIGQAQAGASLAQGQAFSNMGSGILQTLGGLAKPLTAGGGAWQKWQF